MQIVEELGKVICDKVEFLMQSLRKEHRQVVEIKSRPEYRSRQMSSRESFNSSKFDFSRSHNEMMEDVNQALVKIRLVIDHLIERCDLGKQIRNMNFELRKLEQEVGCESQPGISKFSMKPEGMGLQSCAVTNQEPDLGHLKQASSNSKIKQESSEAESSRIKISQVRQSLENQYSSSSGTNKQSNLHGIAVTGREFHKNAAQTRACLKFEEEDVFIDREAADSCEDQLQTETQNGAVSSADLLGKRDPFSQGAKGQRSFLTSSSRRHEGGDQNYSARENRPAVSAHIRSRLTVSNTAQLSHPHLQARRSEVPRNSPKKQHDKKRLEELQIYAQVLQQRVQRDSVSKSKDRNYVRGRYTMYTTEEKRKILEFVQDLGRQEVSRALRIPSKKILQFQRTGPERRKGAGRKQTCPNLERMLLSWMEEKIRIEKALPPTNVCLNEAKLMAQNIGKEKQFKASKGWFAKFKSRNELALKRMLREAQGDGEYGVRVESDTVERLAMESLQDFMKADSEGSAVDSDEFHSVSGFSMEEALDTLPEVPHPTPQTSVSDYPLLPPTISSPRLTN